jgi:aryl carrier-like protein
LGEVPVAVVQGIESQADLEFLRSMQSVVIQQLGLTFAIDEVITLRELGLEQFPQTTSGKVKKIELAAAVRRFREQDQPRRDSATEGIESAKFEIVSPQDPIAALVSDVWSRVLGIDPADLKPDTSIATLADSLTMMQARRLFQKHGLQVSLSELIENPTITAQAELFSGGESRVGAVPSVAQTRDGPPTAIDMVEACGDDSVAQKIQYCATPLLAKHGLTWQNDVEDVLPMYDILANMAAVRRRSRSAMRRDAFWARGVSPSRMSEVLHRALGEYPALRSMWFPTSTSSVSQLVLRPTERCLSAFVSVDIHTVDTPEDLSTVWAGDNARDLCDSQRGPGALFNAIVFNIRSEPDAAGFVYWSNHAAFDATSLSYFWETLDELLDGRSLTPRTNYKLWVDAYYAGRAGPHAQAGAREFGRRLKGFSEWSEQSIVPRAKAPGFMSGNDDGWIDLTTGKPGDAVKRIPLDCESGMYIGNKGLTRVYELPDLKQLQNQHGFAAHTILKASLALANVDWTGTNTSFFRSLQSGRQWPFMDQKLAAYLPSASDVAGPTFQASCDVVHFSHDRHETVGDLLQKMKADQELASRYEHTPLSLALAQLSEADRDAMMERGLSQLFNYLPAARNEGITKLEQVQSEMNADTGLQWDFTSLGAGRIALFVRWDGCQLRKAEVEDMLEDFGDVVAFVSQPQNRVKMLSDREMQTRYHVDHAEHHSPGIEPEVVDVGV